MKKTLWEKLFGCSHNWIVDKTTRINSGIPINAGTSYHWTPYINIQTKDNRIVNIWPFGHMYLYPNNHIMMLKTHVQDAICSKCNKIDLSYTKTLEYAEKRADEVLNETKNVEKELEKFRNMREKAK